MLSESLRGLESWPQFILWKIADKNGKPVKLPVSPHTGQVCNAHSAENWADAATAFERARATGCGVGFVFTAKDPFFFLDIDKCSTPSGWSPLAMQLLSELPGAAVEISQSGAGLHVFGRAQALAHKSKNIALGIELYTADRFVALTDSGTIGNVDTDCSTALTSVVARYFPATAQSEPEQPVALGPRPDWNGPVNDDELLERALASRGARSVFGASASFVDLWEANEETLGGYFPDPGGLRAYDASSADAALAQHLAFWTGCDLQRMQRLMMRSGLVRDKWNRPDYLPRTIAYAVSQQKDVYNQGASEQQAENIRAGYQFLSGQQQLEYFKGCVYVQSLHKALIPSGDLLKPEQFRATYGGYIFALDSANDKTTKNAWEAFTESQVVRQPRAQGVCFRPRLKPGEIIEEENRTLVNTYVPVYPERIEGDPAPFLDHLARVLPDETDRVILLSYMAACVQYRGYKFQWAPLLQGTEGNGKTLFTRCVAYAIGRRYTHYPKASDLDNKFNGWLLNKLFIGVEDIYVPDHRREVLETLKPMITGGDGLEIQFKGADQVTADICANFMLNSNHKDAIQKTQSDRRFAVFFTAQQTAADLRQRV